MRITSHRVSSILVGVAVVGLCGCATRGVYQPASVADLGVADRAVSETLDGVTVSVAVPSPEEATQLLGFKAGKRSVQPVWMEVSNESGNDYWFMIHALDEAYFSPFEVAWMGRKKYTKDARRAMESHLHESAMPMLVPAGETAAGYAYVNQTLGSRHVLVELVGDHREVLSFEFLVDVPGFSADYHEVDFEGLYERFEALDREGLRAWIQSQPAAVTNKKQSLSGDPLNLVVVGHGEAVWRAFARAGWHVTETMSASSTLKTVSSSVFRKSYLYSPISPLYVWERPQDLALQKARATVDERNHLRLWLAPVTCDGGHVWFGQISRDIGVRFTTKSPTISTHKIDPDVDETRSCLLQELIYAEGVDAFAFAGGVGAASFDAPRGNLTGDPYFTDGLRLVLFMSPGRVPIEELDFIEWEVPQS